MKTRTRLVVIMTSFLIVPGLSAAPAHAVDKGFKCKQNTVASATMNWNKDDKAKSGDLVFRSYWSSSYDLNCWDALSTQGKGNFFVVVDVVKPKNKTKKYIYVVKNVRRLGEIVNRGPHIARTVHVWLDSDKDGKYDDGNAVSTLPMS